MTVEIETADFWHTSMDIHDVRTERDPEMHKLLEELRDVAASHRAEVDRDVGRSQSKAHGMDMGMLFAEWETVKAVFSAVGPALTFLRIAKPLFLKLTGKDKTIKIKTDEVTIEIRSEADIDEAIRLLEAAKPSKPEGA